MQWHRRPSFYLVGRKVVVPYTQVRLLPNVIIPCPATTHQSLVSGKEQVYVWSNFRFISSFDIINGMAPKENNKKSAVSSARRCGRPAKFNEPRQPVTMTLPVRVLELLAKVDMDRAKAVSKIVENYFASGKGKSDQAEEVQIGDGNSLIMVANSDALRSIPWMHLIEIAPGRFIISVDSGVPMEKIEVALIDLIDSAASDSEKKALSGLLGCLRSSRRSRNVKKAEILVVGPSSTVK